MASHATDLRTIIGLFDTIREYMDERSAPSSVVTFLHVAMRPGISIQELAEATGLTNSATSRNVILLSKWAGMAKEGYNLVEAAADPRDTRRKLVFLTSQGKRFAEKLVEVLTGSPALIDSPSAKEALDRLYGTLRR